MLSPSRSHPGQSLKVVNELEMVIDNKGRGLRKDAERNRRRIIAAARELFAAKGIDATLNEIAHHAEVGVATVYRRFATKDELIDSVFEDGINEVAEIAECALLQPNSWTSFVWFVERHCELVAADRGLREMLYSHAYGTKGVVLAREKVVVLVSALVERAKKDDYLRPDVTYLDAPILGLLAGTVSEWSDSISSVLWRRHITILLEGMRYRTDQQPIGHDALNHAQTARAVYGWKREDRKLRAHCDRRP